MTWSLDDSYAECQRITRQARTNFSYSFLVLPRAKRRSMCALYAFLRHTDDLGDDYNQSVEVRRDALARWRTSLERALCGEFDAPLFPALADTVAQFAIPPEYLRAVIDGVTMDLDGQTFETWADLSAYCYKVAGVVGLACIHIWGYDGSDAAHRAARACGEAFQLTNILRDLKVDAAADRVYLPQEDLRRFEYTSDDVLHAVRDGRFRALMQFEMARAEELYREAARLHEHLSPEGRKVYGAMTGIYHGLLNEIRRVDGDVYGTRVALSDWRKVWIAARWLARPRWPALWGTPRTAPGAGSR